jgi:alkaline phosphatase D
MFSAILSANTILKVNAQEAKTLAPSATPREAAAALSLLTAQSVIVTDGARGAYAAMPEAAHTVRADVRGLQPGRWYFYRFRVGDEVSAVGRTRTADAPDAKVARLRFAIASCQHYEQGW